MNNKNQLNPKYKDMYTPGESDADATKRLIDIIAVLRSECPWDKEQTHQSLKVCLIEEAYEVCDAIDKNDLKNLEEELGDVLLQVVFHAQIESENGNFLFKDVANGVCEKMIRRHPHIFLNDTAKSVDKALERWENVKRREKGDITTSESMCNLPQALPALTKSYKIQDKAAQVGFDWEDIKYALAKISEEKEELEEAMKNGSSSEIKHELGDLLFSVVNVARFLNVDPEEALNSTSRKFIDRFSYMEDTATQRKLNLDDMSLEEMDALWNEAKSFE